MSIFINRVFLCICIFLLSVRAATLSEAAAFSLEKTYSKFCSGNIKGFKEDLDKIKPTDKHFIDARMYTLFTKEGQVELHSWAQKKLQSSEPLTELDKIIISVTMIFSSDKNFDKIKQLLSFSSKDQMIESYRLSNESYIDELEGRPEIALKKKFEAFYMMPEFDETLLVDIFALASIDRSAERILSPYFGHIDLVPDSSPAKYQLLALKDIAISANEREESIFKNFKKAFELCKHDPTHMVNYASYLIYKNNLVEAKHILKEHIERSQFYSPYIDYFLMKIYSREGDVENEKIHMNKLVQNKLFLLPYERREVEYLTSNSANYSQLYLLICITVVLLFVVCFFWLKHRRK